MITFCSQNLKSFKNVNIKKLSKFLKKKRKKNFSRNIKHKYLLRLLNSCFKIFVQKKKNFYCNNAFVKHVSITNLKSRYFKIENMLSTLYFK